MHLLDHLKRLFAYEAWANRETAASLRAASPASALKRLAHIVAAQRLWLGRLKQDPAAIAVWPELTLEQCDAQLAELSRWWQDYLSGLDAAALSRSISYTNTKGEPWTSTVQDVLLHVVLHSSYHRGQIASEVRASGHAPAYTDFIHSVRQGFI